MVDTEQPTSAASAVAVLPGKSRYSARVMRLILRNMQFLVNDEVAQCAMADHVRSCNLRRMIVRLKQFRDRLGLTLEQMAERTPYSVSQLSRWEAHANNIPSKRLPDLARIYECKVSEIFADDEGEDISLLTVDQLTEMLRIAQQEMSAGTSFADWPRAVATSLYEQLRLIQAVGGLRLSPGALKPAGKAGLSRGTNSRRAPGA